MTNFGWHYPPGVTGREYVIAGAEKEWQEELSCRLCEEDALHDCELYSNTVLTVCTKCGDVNEYESDWWFNVGDMAYDKMKDECETW